MPRLSQTNLEELSEKLAKAISASLSLPQADRPAYIGRHLLAELEGAEPPASPPLDLSAAAVGLAVEVPPLEEVLSSALNAAVASTDTAPPLNGNEGCN